MHAVAQQLVDFGRHPAMRVYAVGDVADGHFVGRHLRPHAVEHLSTHGAVQGRHAVGAGRHLETHDRHVESGVVGLVGATTDAHQLLEADAKLGCPLAKVLLHELDRESVDACWHWSVRGEDATSAG